jgi:hypothetical protein
MAYSQNGDFKAARRDFKRAARLNPSLRRYLPEDTSRVKTEEIEEI